ncbi:Gibberellin 3-beta-dioxygenase 1 [Striga hermonthica]|uniref:Gibberellin 3-beta-dioxygenase 1 n=1 Tax=Striga hermonthica TaxID=68872 RepID=A0A9N7R491_STRHE|nr:Gibberellin 3-beta-dioxygenase 1 [Striga hermonthica]
MKSVGNRIMGIMLKALGANEEYEENMLKDHLFSSEGALQLNSYPSCPNPNRAVGLGPHTDSMLLTILHQNDTNGLQILKEGAEWIKVEPVLGAMVVNIGDLMHIMSNARFRPVYHRVVPSHMRHRFTFAYFYGPSPDYVVAPLANVVLDAPRFRPMMVKEYIRLKYHHFDKALDFVRL